MSPTTAIIFFCYICEWAHNLNGFDSVASNFDEVTAWKIELYVEEESIGNEIENNTNNSSKQTSILVSVGLALKLMKFVVCIFNGINLVMSLQQNEPIKWTFFSFVSFIFVRLFFRLMRPHRRYLFLLLLFSPTLRVRFFIYTWENLSYFFFLFMLYM